MKNKYDELKKIKDKINIIDVISSYLSLSKKGNNYVALCPFHQDKNPSLMISEKKSIFKCFSCGVSGDAISFVSKFNNIGYYDALIKIARENNINISDFNALSSYIEKNKENDILYEINFKAKEYFHSFLFNQDNQFVFDFLCNERGLNEELIEKFQIGYAPKNEIILDLLTNKDNILNLDENSGFKIKDIINSGLGQINKNGEYYSFFHNRFIIPIYDINNQIIGFGGRIIGDSDESKYINTPTTKIFNKDEVLFNLNNVIKDNINCEEIFLVEGYMDAISLSKIGINNVVATMGVAFTEKHLDSLKLLTNLKVINICYDNDDAGIKATIKAADIITKKYLISIIDFPSSHKDIDEIINKSANKNKDEIIKLIDFTTFLIDQQIKKTDFNNLNSKKILLDESIKFLKKENNLISISENVNKLSSLLDIEKNILFDSLLLKKKNNRITINKSGDANYKIEFAENHKKDIGFSSTNGTELEILSCIFISRECLCVFENQCNILLNDEYNEIFNFVQEYYFNHPEIQNIDKNEIVSLLQECQEHLIPYVLKIFINVEKINIKNVQERLLKTINRHMFLIRKEGYKKIIDTIKKYDSIEEKNKFLKKVYNK